MDNEKDKMYIPDIEGVVQPERFGKNLFDYNSDEAKDLSLIHISEPTRRPG